MRDAHDPGVAPSAVPSLTEFIREALGALEDNDNHAATVILRNALGVTEGPAPRWWHCKHCQLEAPTENVNLGPTHKTCGYEVTPATLGVAEARHQTFCTDESKPE